MNNDEFLKKIETLLLDSEKRLTKNIADVNDKVDKVEKNLTKKIESIDMKVDEVEKNLTKKLESVDMKIEIVNKRTEQLEKKLDQSIEDNAHFFQKAGEFFDEMRLELSQRIEKIEKFLDFPTGSKN